MEFSFFALLFLGLGRPAGHLGWRRDARWRRDAGLEHQVDPFIPLLLALGRQLRLAPGDRPVETCSGSRLRPSLCAHSSSIV